MTDDRHSCRQAGVLSRLRDDLAEIEQRRRMDVELTRETLKGVVSHLHDAVSRLEDAAKRNESITDQLGAQSRQIKALFARVDALVAAMGIAE